MASATVCYNMLIRGRLTVPSAGYERKHNACRADIGGCVRGYTYKKSCDSGNTVNTLCYTSIVLAYWALY